jgi:hypothetical protein
VEVTSRLDATPSAEAAAIYSDATKLTIHLEGENTLSSVGSYDGVRFLQGICVEGADVEIVGPGSLDISIVSANITEPTLVTGIYAGSGNVTISDVT